MSIKPFRTLAILLIVVATITTTATLAAAASKTKKKSSAVVAPSPTPKASTATSSTLPLPQVAPVDFTKLKPADFTDDELDLPYFLAHLAEVANAVVSEGPDRGFINLPVWRARSNNKPYNARILENYLSLAWFYTTKRPWNCYYGDPALRARLEAVLERWCAVQSPDGRFSEYGTGEWNLAATAFATKFMGHTLLLLRDGPPLDPALLKRVIDADRQALIAVLSRDDLYVHGRVYTNQFGNVWPGALAYLLLHPDVEVEALLRAQLRKTHLDFQSPAGYFYEKNGPDWSYNLGTEQTNLEAARQLTQDPKLLAIFGAEERLFYDWLSYNAVPEPDGSGFTLNRAVETRKLYPFLPREPEGLFSRVAPPAARLEMARPFCVSKEELLVRRKEARAKLEREWPKVAPLTSFEPYDFLAREYDRALPSEAERRKATEKLPALAPGNLTHQRTDNRFPVTYTYVRRPAYYAAFNSGTVLVEQQRFGLGLLWTPDLGAVLQSQTGAAQAAWGTLPQGAPNVIEAETFQPVFLAGKQAVVPHPGLMNLPDGPLTVDYKLGGKGKKEVVFEDDAIRVNVQYPGAFMENLPLLVGEKDNLNVEDRFAELGRMKITFDRGVKARQEKTNATVGRKMVQVLRLEARDTLNYQIRFEK